MSEIHGDAPESPVEPRPVGRPSGYRTEFVSQAAQLCFNGATLYEVAEFFGVCRNTVRSWANQHPEFLTAIKVGKDAADDRVEASLWERSVGYSHPDVHISSYEGVVTVTPIVKHYPPETAAGTMWMKNRRPGEWKDKTEIEHSGSIGLSERMRSALIGGDDVGSAKTE